MSYQDPNGASKPPITRPPLGDTRERIQFWEESLDQHGGIDRQDVIRHAASALAIRDGEIARLMALVADISPGNRRG